MKSLEQYFHDHSLSPDDSSSAPEETDLSAAEQAFLSKYLGITAPGQQSVARHIPSVTPEQVMAGSTGTPEPPQHSSIQETPSKTRPEPHTQAPAKTLPETLPKTPPETPPEIPPDKPTSPPAAKEADKTSVRSDASSDASVEAPEDMPASPASATKPRTDHPEPAPLTTPSPSKTAALIQDASQAEKALREKSVLQLIGFRLAEQEYALPIDVIQEVIRAVEATKLPSAPDFLSGVINLRGKVTPLVSLRTLLGLPPDEDKFVVVCRHSGLQLGLQIQAVSTMHRVGQDRIDWGVESLLGIQNDYVAGLIRAENRRLIGILSLHHIVQTLLRT